MTRLIPAALAAVLIAAAVFLLTGGPGPQPVAGQGELLPGFRLSDQLGREVTADELRGRVLLVNFIYTSCPDICPMESAFMGTIQTDLAKAGLLGRDVLLVSFTSDPFRDTPETLRQYGERFGADPKAWHFLTGPAREQIDLIQQGFQLAVGYINAEGEVFDPFAERPEVYEVSHSSRFLLVDREGRILESYVFPDLEREELLNDIQRAVKR